MSAISKYLNTKRVIQKFVGDAQAGCTTQKLLPLFGQIITGVRKQAMTIAQGTLLYRCRLHEKGRLFEHVNDLRYPPACRVTKRGRFNEVGESIFYCSNTELGTLVEMDPKLENIFAMAIIRQRENASLPNFLRFRHLDDNDVTAVDENRHRTPNENLVREFIMDELSRPGAERGYSATIAIGTHCFSKGIVTRNGEGAIVPYEGHQHFGITYPSVRAALYTNVRTYNIAMLPATFDECFEISAAELYSLTFDEIADHIRLISHNSATVAKDGELQWKFSYKDMVERTALGIHEHSSSDEKLKVAAQYL